MSEDDPFNDNELAYSAITLFRNQPEGPAPDWQEIADWRADKLTADRAQQVLSHVANDPECFQQWIDLCEATEFLATEDIVVQESSHDSNVEGERHSTTRPTHSPTSFVDKLQAWLSTLFSQPLPVYGAAFGGILLAVLLAPLLRFSEQNSLEAAINRNLALYQSDAAAGITSAPLIRDTRSLGGLIGKPSDAEVERYWFRKGLLDESENLVANDNASWADWRSSLQTDTLDCAVTENPERCTTIAEDLQLTGRWTILAYHACENYSENNQPEFWTMQYDIYELLNKQLSREPSVVMAPVLAQYKPATPAILCEAVNALLTVGQ